MTDTAHPMDETETLTWCYDRTKGLYQPQSVPALARVALEPDAIFDRDGKQVWPNPGATRLFIVVDGGMNYWDKEEQ